MDHLLSIVKTSAELGATEAMRRLGVKSGEKSYRDARNTYGKWFTDAVADGRLKPCRVEAGRAGTKWFSIEEILVLKTHDQVRAVLVFRD